MNWSLKCRQPRTSIGHDTQFDRIVAWRSKQRSHLDRTVRFQTIRHSTSPILCSPVKTPLSYILAVNIWKERPRSPGHVTQTRFISEMSSWPNFFCFSVHFGVPTDEQRQAYTNVLRGILSISTLVFPENLKPAQIDSLVRNPVWGAMDDYAHSTGHGIGAFLSVRECKSIR